MQQARLDLNDFLQYIERHATDLPISAQLALHWIGRARFDMQLADKAGV